MRAFGLGLVLAVVLAGTAWAEIEVDNTAQGWTEPKREVQLAQWPRDANGRLIFGAVQLDCAVADGHAADCKIEKSEPASPLIEKAALALAPLVTSKDSSQARHPLELSILYDTPPDWLSKPTAEAMTAAYPAQATMRGVEGSAIIHCVVQPSGLVRNCTIVKEDPPGWGFGAGAVVLSHTFLFKPAKRDGIPVEAKVSLPINFLLAGSRPGDSPQKVTAAPPQDAPLKSYSAVWTRTPSTADILAEIDKKVGDKFADGLVVLQCHLGAATGRLSDCKVANVSPGMVQFKDVARSLVPKFQADVAALKGIKGDALINLAFAFPDMASADWDKRYLAHPQWIRTISPDPNQATFPEAAAKAGLKTGKATVDCVVRPDGALSQCAVVSESTPNVGFGEMAIQIAETFAANPWNGDGLPVDGAHVRMPIQMDYTPPETIVPVPTPATKP
jgi:TonB family protein